MANFNPTLNTGKVVSTKMLNKSVMEVSIQKPLGFTYKIGQFISLKVTEANFRAYSLVSHPNDENLTIAASVGHQGLGSNFLRDNIQHKSEPEVDFIGPSGKFFMADSPAPTILFLATGTGIAPFIPMLRQLIDYKTALNSKTELYFGETEESELFYMDKLASFAQVYSGFSYTVSLSREQNPKYAYGRITDKYAIKDPLATQVYICGHPNMVAENAEKVAAIGVPPQNIIHEKFTSAVLKS